MCVKEKSKGWSLSPRWLSQNIEMTVSELLINMLGYSTVEDSQTGDKLKTGQKSSILKVIPASFSS